MAAPMKTEKLIVLLCICACFAVSMSEESLEELTPEIVVERVKSGCVFLLLSPDNKVLWNNFVSLRSAFPNTDTSVEKYPDWDNTRPGYFVGENGITVTVGFSSRNFSWNDDRLLRWRKIVNKSSFKIVNDEITEDIAFFRQKKRDRSCLQSPPLTYPVAESYDGLHSVESMVSFLNNNCGTYQTIDGYVSTEGLHRDEIIGDLFTIKSISKETIGSIWRRDKNVTNQNKDEECFQTPDSESKKFCNSNSCPSKLKPNSLSSLYKREKIPQCERRKSLPSKPEFFHNYLKKSKPFILEGAITHWDAFQKWTVNFLRTQYGHRDVHIKLAPDGVFEGVEKAYLWEEFQTREVPDEIYEKLPYPDLVVVRPGTANIKFLQFMDLMAESSKSPSQSNVSAYLEYSSLKQHFPDMEQDVKSFKFAEDLKLEHLNIWLSDGNTLGKLHFDPFDNFLCQIRGTKELILFEPHDNTKLYEGHIPEAMLGYDKTSGRFRRKKLLESTSMVMSPVDILKPDFQRFPRFLNAQPLNCTINEGDALFMPAFWWHEVQSYPNRTEGRNLAVNFWYAPFLTKEFPCPECKLDVNPLYRHLL